MKDLVSEIRSIIETSRSNAVRSVDFCRVQMYWRIGRRIVEEEQDGSARAEYGNGLMEIDRESFIIKLKERLATADISQVKSDVLPFIRDQKELDLWSNDFFLQVADLIRFS